MRITNQIMQRNNLANINTNKVNEDRLSTQMSTEKKINRPSDDPVVAIRALRLRSSVTEVTQYYSRNIPDAESWLSVTEDALGNLTEVLTKMISNCTKGANGPLTTDDRKIILEQLQGLADEIYSTGDVDYAGRYVFTGRRTDTSLSFDKQTEQLFEITEQLDINSIDDMTKVYTDELLDINSSNFMNKDVTEQDISSVDYHRIRLAYNDCDDVVPEISFWQKDANGEYAWVTWNSDGFYDADGNLLVDENGNNLDAANGYSIQKMHSYEDPYSAVANDPDAVIYVPETGEILLGENRYNDLMSAKDDPSTATRDEGEIRVTYQKTNWQKGDLRPQHYFACTSDGIQYNQDYLTGNPDRQVLEYDVGFNQTIRINTTADECFSHGIGREADDLISAMQNVQDLENIEATLKELITKYEGDSEATAKLQDQLDAVEKALTLAKDKEQKLFESGITSFQKYLDSANLAVTNCGNRSSKLDLIENRMKTQKTTFETLKSTNEDIDIAEVTIHLKAAGLVYEAALLAAGKVMQSTLLNYI